MTATALDENVTNETLTIGQYLAEGPLPLAEALRQAMMLADALRQLHDSGRTCGVLTPSNIAVTHTGLELIATPSHLADITPYTAPELLQGQPADVRSDIFAFGAILYEMVMDHRAFTGDSPEELAASLTTSAPPLSGTPGVDHVIANCIAKDPDVRYQRMQKVILELKLLTFAAPRAEVLTRQRSASAALRAETQQLEARMTTLLQTHEKAIFDIQQTSADTIKRLCEQLSSVESQLAQAQERYVLIEDHCQQIAVNVEQVQQNVETVDERVTHVKEGLDVLGDGANVVQQHVGTRMREFEQALKSQRAEIASVVAGQAQTDDVVEGVVRAMELLHAIVVDRAEE
jgi:serine/threonine protein kinase